MFNLNQYKKFEWDKGNVDKSYQKHGITPNETEEAFLDEDAIILLDVKHSRKEKRYLLLGKNATNMVLLAVFTLREKKIRITSARKANKKERNKHANKN